MKWLETLLSSDLGGTLGTVLFIAAAAVVTVVGARIVNRLLRRLVERQKARDTGTATVVAFLRYIAVAAVYFVGAMTVVSSVPWLSSAVNKLLAAGGVIAVIGGFAAQEALGSVVSGMMILAFKPFRIGDVVRYVESDISGVIEEITLHHTVIRTWENKRVTVPNSKMNAAVLENADYGESRVCVFLEVGVTYESDVQLAKTLLARAVAADARHLDVRTPDERRAGVDEVPVVVLRLDDSAVVLRASLWAKDNGTAFALKCAVQERILTDFAQNDVDIAYPHLVVQKKEA